MSVLPTVFQTYDFAHKDSLSQSLNKMNYILESSSILLDLLTPFSNSRLALTELSLPPSPFIHSYVF